MATPASATRLLLALASLALGAAGPARAADQDYGGFLFSGCPAKILSPEMVTNVSRGASQASARVSIAFGGFGPPLAAGSGAVEARLAYGSAPGQWSTRVTECSGDGRGGCIGEPGELLVFELAGLEIGREYHYRVECRESPAGSGTRALWQPRPPGRFVASRPRTGASFTFLHESDTHTGAEFPRAGCGADDDTTTLTLYATMRRMALERADFAIDTGDTAQLRSTNPRSCREWGGLSTGRGAVGSPGEPAATADARWRLTLQHPRLFGTLLRLGGAFAHVKGNHEGETGFDTLACDRVSNPGCHRPSGCADDAACDNVGPPSHDPQRHGTRHYAHSGPDGESQFALAMAARLRVMPPWTTLSGHPDGHYYGFDWGNARFVVLDNFAFFDPSTHDWGHPSRPADWEIGAEQWSWFRARVDECDTDADCDFVFVAMHHVFGGITAEPKWYHYGRMAWKGRAGLAGKGAPTDDFRGEQARIQAHLARAVDGGGLAAAVVLLGHDHVGTWCEKPDAGGGSGVWYVSATQPSGGARSSHCLGGPARRRSCREDADCPGSTCALQRWASGGPNWAYRPSFRGGYDCDADGRAQFLESPVDDLRPGSLLRGYHRIRVEDSPPRVTIEAIASQVVSTFHGNKRDPLDGSVLFSLAIPGDGL